MRLLAFLLLWFLAAFRPANAQYRYPVDAGAPAPVAGWVYDGHLHETTEAVLQLCETERAVLSECQHMAQGLRVELGQCGAVHDVVSGALTARADAVEPMPDSSSWPGWLTLLVGAAAGAGVVGGTWYLVAQ